MNFECPNSQNSRSNEKGKDVKIIYWSHIYLIIYKFKGVLILLWGLITGWS
jgi:hypothetical protein